MIKKPLPLTFFIDHCVGRKIVPAALRSAGAQVEVLLDHFPTDTPDIVWLPIVSQQGWIVITQDSNLESNLLESRAIAAANAKVFILSGKLTGEEMAAILVTELARIQKFVQGNQAPFIARITKAGQVTQIKISQNRTQLRKLLKSNTTD